MPKIYGPKFDFTAVAVPVVTPKAVPEIALKNFVPDTEPVTLELTVKPYQLVDPATQAETHKLTRIDVVCLAQGFPLPTNPDDLLSGAHPSGSADTSANLGGDYAIPIPNSRDVVGGAGGIGSFQSILTLDD